MLSPLFPFPNIGKSDCLMPPESPIVTKAPSSVSSVILYADDVLVAKAFIQSIMPQVYINFICTYYKGIYMVKHRTSIEFPPELWKKLSTSVPERKKSSFIIQAIEEKFYRESLKTVILCGGQGAKMRPLTLTIPKPMLPIGYKPILEHIISFFKSEGLFNFIFAIGYLGENIIKYFNDGSQLGVSIKYSSEEKPLGTAGALKKIENLVSSPFVVSHGDTIFRNLSVKNVLKFHSDKKTVGTMVLWKTKDARPFGLVELDDEGKIISFREKPKYPTEGWVSTGLYVFNNEIFNYIPKNKFFTLEFDIFPKLIDRGKLFGYFHNGYWADVSRPEDYEKISKDLLIEKVL